MEYIKNILKRDDIHIRRLYTMSQIAIHAIVDKLKKQDNKHIFMVQHKGMIYWPKNPEKIHSAYRGGRVDAFQVGEFEHVSAVDCNSLYPFSIAAMPFPDLRGEYYIEAEKEFVINNLLNKIGITRCMVRNNTNEIGLLPVRTRIGNYFPKQNTIMIGTWTHMELKLALDQGYEILQTEWSIIWDNAPNPFLDIMNDLYKARKESRSEFEDFFYKNIMNHGIGKFAQRKPTVEIVIDSVEEAEKYLERNYKILRGTGLNYLYSTEIPLDKPKNYYAPIIPTLVNAYARCYMYKQFLRFRQDDLLYTDTDSIVFKGSIPEGLLMGSGMGEFKVQHSKENCLIYGRKAYSIGTDIKLSGIHQASLNMADFTKGTVLSTRMYTLRTAPSLEKVGTFYPVSRDLTNQQIQHNKVKELFEEQNIYIDEDLKSVDKYLDTIKRVGDTWLRSSATGL